MGETVDVIVLGESSDKSSYLCIRTFVAGGEFGSGKRGGGVSTLLVGVLDDRQPIGQDGPK